MKTKNKKSQLNKAYRILKKYKVVDGNKIIAKSREEMQELIESEVSTSLGITIVYSHNPTNNVNHNLSLITRCVNFFKKLVNQIKGVVKCL